MARYHVTDWDDAYANGVNIPNGDAFPDRWNELAGQFRQQADAKLDVSYGSGPREVYDLFLPKGPPIGLHAFVHGGYWMAFDKGTWSHLAKGGVESGWAVCVPSYPLCPDATLTQITHSIRDAIAHAAAQIDGPIVLTGHSAGGHLVTSLVCDIAPLPDNIVSRLKHVVSISGLHDLRPLLMTKLNDTLSLNKDTSAELSPALYLPLTDCPITAYVGANERPEFLRQSQLLANVWAGAGVSTACIEVADRHHFDVIDALCDPISELSRLCFR